MTFLWWRAMLAHRAGRLASAAAGVAVAVALLASLGSFLAASKATMTQRSARSVAIDWQVEVQPGSDPAKVLALTSKSAGVRAALPVGFAQTSGLESTTSGTTQTTGPGRVLGIPPGYQHAFPGALRTLTGRGTGVLLAQQTAANLHAAPGDTVRIGRAGLPPVTLKIDGVVELPQADSLFQKVGAPPQSQLQAPPDNVVLLPSADFKKAFGPLAQRRPDLVQTQIHVVRTRALATDPAAAFTQVTTAANNLEARSAGAAVVGNNLGAALGSAREDALYSQILFLFLGVPGAALAAALTAVIAGAGAVRRRREQSLLRTRGGSRTAVLRLAFVEAATVGVVGSLAGLALAAAVGQIMFGKPGFGTTPAAGVVWALTSGIIGLVVATATVVLPVRRDLRENSVAAGRAVVGRYRRPRWMRYGVDLILIAVSLVIFYATSRNNYALVLAPEGVPTISVNYWAFLGPALMWIGAGLLAWRLVDALMGRRRLLSRGLRPIAGNLSGTVASTMSGQRHLLARSIVLMALAIAFAASTATFNATYNQQAKVDAQLTAGADVTVTESPGASMGPGQAVRLARVAGVRHVEPMQHRFAYVGSDLQDLYGIHPSTIASGTSLQDAYFQGGTAGQLLAKLAAQPDGVLVSAETVHDFQLQPGDALNLRLLDGRTGQQTKVGFHYAGVVNEFPTAPKDSFFVANADYVAAKTHNATVGTFLVDTGGKSTVAVAQRMRHLLGTSAQVTDITHIHGLIASSLTAVDLAGLTKVELSFALVLVAAAGGLVLALGLAERRRSLAIAAALGASRRQLRSFVTSEAAVVTIGGLVGGAAAGWALTQMLVKVLTGVFDPPPAHLAVPWAYLVSVMLIAGVAMVGAAAVAMRMALQPAVEQLREL
jgi:putative ABC transport system permease protein